MVMAGSVLADGMPGSAKDAPPAPEGRKFTWGFNLGVTSDYIFRGVSQNREKPAFQAGVDFSYGIFYVGAWGSDVNFGLNPDGTSGLFNVDGSGIANAEVDFYAGIKPVLGPVTFDIGVIQYTYWGGKDGGPARNQVFEQDFTEIKVGASATFIPKLTTGITAYFSPQFQGNQGFVTTVEGTIAYEFPVMHKITPTVSGTFGSMMGDAGSTSDPFILANGKDSYQYWNAGLTLGMDKLSIDFRYWDTNIQDIAPGQTCFGTGALFACDSRFVATAKVTF